MSNGCSRWSRYLSDNTDAADAECDDDDRLSAGACHANQTASTTEWLRQKEAGSRYVVIHRSAFGSIIGSSLFGCCSMHCNSLRDDTFPHSQCLFPPTA